MSDLILKAGKPQVSILLEAILFLISLIITVLIRVSPKSFIPYNIPFKYLVVIAGLMMLLAIGTGFMLFISKNYREFRDHTFISLMILMAAPILTAGGQGMQQILNRVHEPGIYDSNVYMLATLSTYICVPFFIIAHLLRTAYKIQGIQNNTNVSEVSGHKYEKWVLIAVVVMLAVMYLIWLITFPST